MPDSVGVTSESIPADGTAPSESAEGRPEPAPRDGVAPVPQVRDPHTSRQHALHAAARVEDRLNGLLSRWLARRGWRPHVEPYTGYGAPGWARIMARGLLAAPDASSREATERDAASAGRAVRGWRSFLTAQVPGAVVEVTVGSFTHTVTADRGGYVDAVVESDLPAGWQEATVRLGEHTAVAPVLVVGPEQTSALVSDIDDTVMVTALPRPMLAFWNSMVLHESARRVVPGMADLYRRWLDEHPGAPTFYLSTGAWNVAPALRRFLHRNRYPAGPLLLTDWGPTNTGWFRSGQEHKIASLRRLMDELPQVRWLLVGDDGQHDPQIYGQIAEEFGERVELIAIRELTAAEQVLAHGTPVPTEDAERSAPKGTPEVVRPGDGEAGATADTSGTAPEAAATRVVRGADGNALALRLLDEGILRPAVDAGRGVRTPRAPR